MTIKLLTKEKGVVGNDTSLTTYRYLLLTKATVMHYLRIHRRRR
jgi:hypothetical protein